MRVYTGSRTTYVDNDTIDITPGTADAVGRELLACLSGLRGPAPGLLRRYLDGILSLTETAALELYLAAQIRMSLVDLSSPITAARLISEVLGRFAPRVVVVCDCVYHHYGHCLRYLVAREMTRSGTGRYFGDLHRQPSGRFVPKPMSPITDRLTIEDWRPLLGLISDDIPLAFLTEYAPAGVIPRRPVTRTSSIPVFASALGLSRWPVSEEELTAAWRAAAMSTHPDRPTGSNRAFSAVKAAYDRARAALGVR